MTTSKYSLRPKQFLILTMLVLTASSLFAFFAPEVFFLEEKAETKIDSTVLFAHPLAGISDNVLPACSEDGSYLHEFFLCGADAERLVTTNIPNLKQIIWSKLQDGSCGAAQVNCGNTSPICIWDQVSTNTQYNLTTGGEYRIYVQYDDNTSERFYFNVYANGLNPSSVVTNIDCGTDGSITINNVPSTYEFSINSGATWQDSNVFPITSVGNYNIQIRRKNDTDGCVFNLDDIAVGNNSIDATTTVLPISCNASKGGIQVDISNASSSYVFKISQGGNLINTSGTVNNGSYTFPDLAAGTYDIEVTLASVSNCIFNAVETIPGFVNIQPDVVVTKNIDCTDGVITVAPTGGNAPFEYSLNGAVYVPFTSGNQTTIPIGTADSYTIKVKDANGCEIEAAPVNVISEPEILYTPVAKDISCNGTDDGSITVDVTNTQGYSITYSIDGGNTFQASNVFSNLAANTYSIIIRKEKAGGTCDLPASTAEVRASTAFTASASVTQQIDCTNGSATIATTVSTGGIAPFEYSLDGKNFQNDSNLTGLGAGDYTITVKDLNGCLTTVDQTVDAGSSPSDLTFLNSAVDCSTGTTDVQISVQNGEDPFTYRITAPINVTAPDDTFTALAPNTYTFEVTADDGCKIIRNYVVENPIQFTTNALVKNNVSCATTGMADGTISLSVDNFNTSFSVVVEDGLGNPLGLGLSNQTSSPLLISGLLADTYTIKINDESGPCQKVETATVAGPPSALSVDSFSVANMNCGTAGAVTIEASGGWGNYRYSVQLPDNSNTPLQSNKTITGLTQPGQHTIRVTDVNGCLLDTTTFDLIDQGGPVSVVDTSGGAITNYCYSTATLGVLKIDVSGGEAPYFYTKNKGTPVPITGGTFTLSGLTPDDYLIEVIGNNGCKTVVADTKISGQLFALAEITKPYGCGATPDAIINVTPQEGYPPHTYRVDSGSGYSAVTMPFSASVEGSYTFEVTDGKGCTFTTDPVNVAAAPMLGFNHNITDTACGKTGTGSVQLVATGGTPPYEYAFSDTPFSGSNPAIYDSRAVFTSLDATTYYFAIKDALGCTIENEQAIIGAESAIAAEIEKTDIQCDPVKGGNVWGNIKVKNIQNSTSPVTISLIRVQDPVKYAAGDDTRTWTYRRYQNIDLATNSNYNSANKPALYGTNTGFDIRMYWAHHFVVRVEDDRGCFWESTIYTIDSPPIPSGVTSPVALQTCANGATYDFSITNVDSDNDGTPDLVGPFEVRLYPYQLVDDDGDGIEDDVTSGWRPFNDAENPLWDGIAGTAGNPNERDYRFTNSTLYGKLLFGVAYSVAIRDKNTGCIRWRALRPIVQPPSGFITVDAVPQSETCRGSQDGEVELTIENYAPGTVNVKVYSANRPANASFQYNPPPQVGTGAPLTLTIPNMRVSWYVVEVEDSSGCTAGERFLIYRPKTKLKLKEDLVIQPTCSNGGQVAVTATGGWDNERYFNIRNKLTQNWHPYEYALVLDSQTPTDPDFGPDNFWTNIIPSSYTGGQNVYRAYVRDGSGCIEPLPNAITFTKAEEPIINQIDVTDRCSSTTELYNVVATLSQLGTNPENTDPVYIWDGEITFTDTKILGPGHHTLEVRDENGCSDTQTIHIYPQMVPQVKITKTVDCEAGNPNNGEIEASAYGGSGTYNFTLSPIPASYASGDETNATGNFDRLEPGVSYSVIVADIDPAVPVADRCSPKSTIPIQLEAPVDPLFVGEVIQDISCHGNTDGIIRIVQISGADNLDVTYEYSLDGSSYQTSNLFNNRAAGTYSSINVRSSKNCIQSIPDVIIGGPTAPLEANTPTVSPFTCTSDNTLGMATITVGPTGGTAPYQYKYDGGGYTTSNTYEIPYLTTARTITVDIIDKNSCQATVDVDILAATKVEAEIVRVSSGPMNCVDNEVINVTFIANTGFSNNVSNYEVRELPSGNLINGTGHGSIDLGAGNPGTYVYEMTDLTTNCTDQVEYTIDPFDTIDVSALHGTNITCRGASDGSLSFTATGFGTSGFEYEVYKIDNAIAQSKVTSSSSASIPISGLPAGTYFVRVTDIDTKCAKDSAHITIQSPAFALDVEFDITQSLTCNGTDAQVTLTPKGGWGNYEFELVETLSGNVRQAFSPNNVIGGLSGISYQLRIRDSGVCTPPAAEIIIPPIDPIVIDDTADVTTNDPSCPGNNDGEITVVVTRANGPSDYKYILTNTLTGVSSLPQYSNTFTDLYAGTYAVTVKDDLNCGDTTDVPIVLNNPFVLEIDAAITQEFNCAPNSGEITVSATGNLGDTFEYQMIAPSTHHDAGIWRAETSNSYSNLEPGTYEFIAKNQNNCESPISVIRTITDVEDLVVSIDDTNTIINCAGEADAVLVATATGGLGGYQYQLELNGILIGTLQNSGIFENLGPGSYRIRATGGDNCEDYTDTPTVIEQPPALLASLGAVENVKCFGELSGSITVTSSGGVQPHQYIISSQPQKAQNSNVFEGLDGGTYSVIVQDANGCEFPLNNITLTAPTATLAVDIVRVDDEECSVDNNGLIALNITGGTAPYEYNLTGMEDPSTTISGNSLLLDNLDGGFYNIYVKDANGCSALIVQEVKVGVDLSATVQVTNDCRDGHPYYEASILFEDEALDTDEIVYDLDDANPDNPDVNDAQSTADFPNISSGNHTISIVHLGTGCIEVQRFNIQGQTPLSLTTLDGTFNEILVEATGGDGDYIYYFEDTPSSSGSYFINQDGNYLVRVVDRKGCEASIEVPMEFIDIEIPNFFTPDGDGYKDKWIIKNTEAFPDIYVRVYDRYGRTIKEFIGQGEWDGSYNQTDLPTGDYWYVIKLNGPNDRREFVGNVTVYR